MKKFKKNPFTSNYLLDLTEDGKNYISFHPHPHGALPIFVSDNNSSETAVRLNDKWMILNGDFKEKYEKAFDKDGLAGVLKIYKDNKEQYGSTWSTNEINYEHVEKWINERLKNL